MGQNQIDTTSLMGWLLSGAFGAAAFDMATWAGLTAPNLALPESLL